MYLQCFYKHQLNFFFFFLVVFKENFSPHPKSMWKWSERFSPECSRDYILSSSNGHSSCLLFQHLLTACWPEQCWTCEECCVWSRRLSLIYSGRGLSVYVQQHHCVSTSSLFTHLPCGLVFLPFFFFSLSFFLGLFPTENLLQKPWRLSHFICPRVTD